MNDLTQYSDSELSLVVFNNEFLYDSRKNLESLREILDEAYIYTSEQWDELVQDIEDDLNEDN